ncbi:hypothetical protein, partial [Spiroplasma melliferum]|uniref:hypothetical protein n=1 Tax=Spiroplasma melliferum TaxID=2134 RepID=UPI0015E157DB
WFWLESTWSDFSNTFLHNWNVTGGRGVCNNNFGNFFDSDNWYPGDPGIEQNTKSNFNDSIFISTSTLNNKPQKFAINDVNSLNSGIYYITLQNLQQQCIFSNMISSVNNITNFAKEVSFKIWISDDFKLHIGISKISYPNIGMIVGNNNYFGNDSNISYIADTIHMVNQGGKIDIILIPSN